MPNNDSTAPSLSDFFSALSEEKADQRKKLRERINAPESELSTLFSLAGVGWNAFQVNNDYS